MPAQEEELARQEADQKLQQEADIAFRNGTEYHNVGDYVRAIVDFDRAIKIDPTNAYYYYRRGISFRVKKDYDRAIADFTRAIELDPNQAGFYLERGISYTFKDDQAQAFVDFDRAIKIDPPKPIITIDAK